MARILIVEDSSAMRAYARSALEEQAPGLPADLEVVEAVGGLDALRLLPRGEFDLMITDINMPDINGLELIRFVRQGDRYRRLAVLIISTQAGERDLERGIQLGADAFLPKPFSPDALRSAVGRVLAARRIDTAPPETARAPGRPGGEARG